jgi:hypothetical protein
MYFDLLLSVDAAPAASVVQQNIYLSTTLVQYSWQNIPLKLSILLFFALRETIKGFPMHQHFLLTRETNK